MRQKVPVERVRELIGTDRGLTHSEIEERLTLYGPNDIVEAPGHPWRELLRETSRDPMVWFLVGTAFLYLFLGSRTEALTLLAALLPLVGMDAYLHRRTQASTSGLSRQLAETACALRDGIWTEVAAVKLVPGDRVRVRAGEAFPADGLVVDVDGAQADESSLTGEAYPVRKQVLPSLPAGVAEPLVEETYWGFAGTRLLTGSLSLRVVHTGRDTLYGAIVRSATHGSAMATPLQQAVTVLVRTLLAGAMALCTILAAVRLLQGHGWLDAIVSAATLAVAALPEEFPVVFTVFLGVGVYRLARRQALVRRAVSVENIGRVTCICSDKTGTMTEGRLSLDRSVPRLGLDPEELLSLASLASRSESGDPLDAAILEAAAPDRSRNNVLATFPFTEARRRETAVVEREGRALAVTKGSPEVVFDLSRMSERDRASWEDRVRELASGRRKVIACASRELPSDWPGGEPDRGYELLGALVFEDPIRPGVREAVAACRRAGIRVVMITGDHAETARSVAAAIGLSAEGVPDVVEGELLDDHPSDLLGERLAGVDVIARAMPAQKLQLVRALQAVGEIVVVTGDGVNDVPALQAADVGVAMGERGTRSAREVASIVLLDDDFTSIVHAIGEGRQLFRNLQHSFQYLMMIHIPLVLTATFIPLAGYPLLYLPIHIVWLEALIHPTALLAFQDLPATDALARERPRRQAQFFGRLDWVEIALVGALATALVAVGYDRSLGPGLDVEHARAMALVALSAYSASLAALLSALRTRAAAIIAAATLALALGLVQIAPLAAVLQVRPLHLDDWILGLSGGAVAALLPRLLRRLFFRS